MTDLDIQISSRGALASNTLPLLSLQVNSCLIGLTAMPRTFGHRADRQHDHGGAEGGQRMKGRPPGRRPPPCPRDDPGEEEEERGAEEEDELAGAPRTCGRGHSWFHRENTLGFWFRT